MSIENKRRFQQALPAGFDGVFNWDWIGPLPFGIKPMDIDCVIHAGRAGGYHLLIETKDVGVPIQRGQEWALMNLLKTGRVRAVLIIFGKDRPAAWAVWKWSFMLGRVKKSRTWRPENPEAEINQFIMDWFLEHDDPANQARLEFETLQLALNAVCLEAHEAFTRYIAENFT